MISVLVNVVLVQSLVENLNFALVIVLVGELNFRNDQSLNYKKCTHQQ